MKISFIKWMYILEERDRTKYLGLLSSDEKNERIFDRIRYLTQFKINVSYVSSHEYRKIEIDLDDDLPLQKNIKYP